MNLVHILPQIAVVIGAAVILLVSLAVPHQRQWVGAPIAVATLVTATVAQSMLLTRPGQASFDGLWALDATTGIAAIVIYASTAVAVLLSPEWMASDPRHGEYYTLLLLSALGAVVLVAATDLNQLIVGIVLSSVTGYVLAGYHRRSPMAVEAGMSYFLIGGLANLVLLVAALFFFAAAGTTLYRDMATAAPTTDAWLLIPLAITATVALSFKAGAVPAHGWIPDVAQGAPIPSAAFLTVVPKIGGTIALARIAALLPAESGMLPAVAMVSALTMTLGNLAALRQDDVRRLLGWSSVSQAGYALMGVAAIGGSDQALGALVLFLAAYAAANLAAFAVVGQLRGRTTIADYAGLVHSRPWLVVAITVSFLSLVGIPPLAGFAGKFALFTAAIDAGLGWLAALAVVNTVISLAYYLRVIAPAYLGGRPSNPIHVLGRWSATATFLAVAVTSILAGASDPVVRALAGRTFLP